MNPDSTLLTLSRKYAMLREENEAWRLLNAHRSPLILACAEELFSGKQEAVTFEEAVQLLAESFIQFSNDSQMQIYDKDPYKLARKEWRDWLKRKLIIERDGEVFATNALQKVLNFVKNLDDGMMTSTASRLTTVKDRIQQIAIHLDDDPKRREAQIKAEIAELEQTLKEVQQGNIDTLSDTQAEEAIQDVYQLSMSLRGDFRRVEDSYRKADQQLREQVIKDDYHRGDIVTNLLDSNDKLLSTPEGQVFYNFNQQLKRSDELQTMRRQIREIIKHPSAKNALSMEQSAEFAWLTLMLNKEAQQVSKAKERSEKDVRGFLQTGLASEQHRVGELLKQIFHEALDLPWESQKLRRTASVLPPIAIKLDKVPAISRLSIKEIKDKTDYDLDVTQQHSTSLDELDRSFWQAFDGLDKADWFKQTMQALQQKDTAMTLGQLSQILSPPPRYDFEAIAMWMELAHSADDKHNHQTAIQQNSKPNNETILLTDDDGMAWQFTIPKVTLTAEMLESVADEYV